MKSLFALAGAFVICPCHFPITLALLATTGFGAFLLGYQAIVYTVSGILFLGMAALGIVWFKREREHDTAKAHGHAVGAACEACGP